MRKLTAEIITIGAELLKGSVLNTNARFLGRELTRLGFAVLKQTSCPDEVFHIHHCLEEAMHRSQLVILSGGLGPTPDDLTREGVAACFQVPLLLSRQQFNHIRQHYRRQGRSVPELVKKEAMYPQGAVPLVNRHGIALGFYVLKQGRLVVVLPGVPSELEKMFTELVCPLIQKYFSSLPSSFQLVVKTLGLSEPEIMKRLGQHFFDDPFEFGIYPEPGEVTLRLQAGERRIIRRLEAKVQRSLRGHFYALEEITLAEAIGRLLVARKRTLACAESCTGGRLAAELTSVPGSSRYFSGSLVCYANEAKESILGIPSEMIRQHGAVSREVALRMAQAVRKKLRTHYGMAITGIAGPGGGSPAKPVGCVHIALATARYQRSWPHHFSGNRHAVQNKAVKKALEYLWRDLRNG